MRGNEVSTVIWQKGSCTIARAVWKFARFRGTLRASATNSTGRKASMSENWTIESAGEGERFWNCIVR